MNIATLIDERLYREMREAIDGLVRYELRREIDKRNREMRPWTPETPREVALREIEAGN